MHYSNIETTKRIIRIVHARSDLWVITWAVPRVDQWAEIGRFGFDTFSGSRPTMTLLSWILPTGADKRFAANCLYFGISVPSLVYTLFILS